MSAVKMIETLSDQQIELVLARILGYHAKLKGCPYVMIDDWNKEGTIVDGCRFQPMTDEVLCDKLTEHFDLKMHYEAGKWTALSHVRNVFDASSVRCRAVVKCIVRMHHHDGIPVELLEDNPLEG